MHNNDGQQALGLPVSSSPRMSRDYTLELTTRNLDMHIGNSFSFFFCKDLHLFLSRLVIYAWLEINERKFFHAPAIMLGKSEFTSLVTTALNANENHIYTRVGLRRKGKHVHHHFRSHSYILLLVMTRNSCSPAVL